MTNTSFKIQAAASSLIGLIVINCVMLGALFSQVPPNPPGRFGPFIGSTVALAAVSLSLVWWQNKIGYVSSIAVGIMCLVSVGPQKLFFGHSAVQLAPVIILGSIFALALIISSITAIKETSDMNTNAEEDIDNAPHS